jgi:glc operon protein GlcG
MAGGEAWMTKWAIAAAALALVGARAGAQAGKDVVITGDAAGRVLSTHELSVVAAEKIAKLCVEFARSQKISVNIAIVNSLGKLVYTYRMDGALPFDVDTSIRKAETVIVTRMSTAAVAQRYGKMPNMHTTMYELGAFPFRGGVPIMLNGEMIGAVGVGGGSGQQDEQCGYDAVVAVVGPQPPRVME